MTADQRAQSSEAKRKTVVGLYRIGMRTPLIAEKVNVSVTRVRQMVKEDIKLKFKREGSDETRLDMFAELEMVKQELLARALGEGMDASPDKDTVKSLLAVVRQQATLVGGSAPAGLMGGDDLPGWAKEQRALVAYNKRQRAAGGD